MRLVLSLFVLLAQVVSFGDNKVFSYIIPDADQPWGGNCNEVAQKLKIKFESVTGAKALSSRCEYDSLIGTTYLTLRYQADTTLEVTTTNRHNFAGVPNENFASERSCVSALPEKVAQFEGETRLKPFVAFCRFDRLVSPNPWSVYIDAFGAPEKNTWLTSAYVDATPYDYSPSEIEQIFSKKFAERGAVLDWLTVRTQIPYNAIVAFSYSKTEPVFNALRIVHGLSMSQCAETKTRVSTAIAKAGFEPILTFCGSPYSNAKRFELWNLHFENGSVPKISEAEENFETIEACLSQQNILVTKYQTQFGWPIVGSVCGFIRDMPRLVFIENPARETSISSQP